MIISIGNYHVTSALSLAVIYYLITQLTCVCVLYYSKHHEAWNGLGYIYNPSIPKIQSLLRGEEKKDNTTGMCSGV
jgi:hypothetical protein